MCMGMAKSPIQILRLPKALGPPWSSSPPPSRLIQLPIPAPTACSLSPPRTGQGAARWSCSPAFEAILWGSVLGLGFRLSGILRGVKLLYYQLLMSTDRRANLLRSEASGPQDFCDPTRHPRWAHRKRAAEPQ